MTATKEEKDQQFVNDTIAAVRRACEGREDFLSNLQFTGSIAKVLLDEITRLTAESNKHAGDAAVWESRYGNVHEECDRLEDALRQCDSRRKALAQQITGLTSFRGDVYCDDTDDPTILDSEQVNRLLEMATENEKLDFVERSPELPDQSDTRRRSFAYGVYVGGKKRYGGTVHARTMEEVGYIAAMRHKYSLVERGTAPYTNTWDFEDEDGKKAQIYVWVRPEDPYYKPLREDAEKANDESTD